MGLRAFVGARVYVRCSNLATLAKTRNVLPACAGQEPRFQFLVACYFGDWYVGVGSKTRSADKLFGKFAGNAK